MAAAVAAAAVVAAVLLLLLLQKVLKRQGKSWHGVMRSKENARVMMLLMCWR